MEVAPNPMCLEEMLQRLERSRLVKVRWEHGGLLGRCELFELHQRLFWEVAGCILENTASSLCEAQLMIAAKRSGLMVDPLAYAMVGKEHRSVLAAIGSEENIWQTNPDSVTDEEVLEIEMAVVEASLDKLAEPIEDPTTGPLGPGVSSPCFREVSLMHTFKETSRDQTQKWGNGLAYRLVVYDGLSQQPQGLVAERVTGVSDQAVVKTMATLFPDVLPEDRPKLLESRLSFDNVDENRSTLDPCMRS
ncbi:hypothetical protein OQA88_4464 [Cercophora sp. LCS_1]